MPQALSKHFGEFEYDDAAVLTFPCGLPAFEGLKRFVLLERPSTAPVVFLQSLDDGHVCLPAAPISAIRPDYELALSPDDARTLRIADVSEIRRLACLAVVSIPETGPPTANLLAPVVIDSSSRLGVQAVRSDARYSHRQALSAHGEAVCS